MTYNLLEEGWIPVLYRNGKNKRIGICRAFKDAGRIRQIAASNPMDRVAILRFLLALLYWCKGNPPDGPIPGDSFPMDWFAKLKERRDCFDLLGEGKRFYQDTHAKRERPGTDLLQEIPAGNNFWHFRHATDHLEGLCPACCALGLLRLPMFSVSGLSGPGQPHLMAGINGVPPIYAVSWHSSLLETLLANWTPCSKIGNPTWNGTDICSNAIEDVSVLTGLTLLSRRVWLRDQDGHPGVCIGCGSSEKLLIRTIEFQTAGKQENDNWNDPHVVYEKEMRKKATRLKALRAEDPTRAKKFRLDRPWAELLCRAVETGRTASLLVVGFATDKAKNVDVWERSLTLPGKDSIPAETASRLIRWREAGKALETGAGRPKVSTAAHIAAIRPHVEHEISARAGELIENGAAAWDKAAAEYRPMMEAVARSLAPGFTTEAVRRRKELAGSKPVLAQKQATPPKRSRRKGGNA